MQLNVKTVLFQIIQFSISMQFSSIWPFDRTLSSATTPGQSGPGSDGNERVFRIPQSSCITGTSLSDRLVSVGGGPLCRGVVSVFYIPSQQGNNVLDCNVLISKFELQSCYYVHFQSKTLGKSIKCWRTSLHSYVQWDGFVFLLTVVVFDCGSLTNLFESVCPFFVLWMDILLWYLLLVFWSVFLGELKGSRIIPLVCQWPGRLGFNPRLSHAKDSKHGTRCHLA